MDRPRRRGVTMDGTVEPAELRRLLLAQDPRTGTPLREITHRVPSSAASMGLSLTTAEAASCGRREPAVPPPRRRRSLRPPGGDRHSYVRNGTQGRVVRVDVDTRSVTVDFEQRGPIDVPWSFLITPIRPGVTGGLTHSYALTSHAAQGETYRAGRHLASDRSTRNPSMWD